jgi:hypothetical protein
MIGVPNCDPLGPDALPLQAVVLAGSPGVSQALESRRGKI